MKPIAKAPKSERATQNAQFTDRQEEIRRRAYELYEQRGREDGHDLDDWLLAESDVDPKKRKTFAV